MDQGRIERVRRYLRQVSGQPDDREGAALEGLPDLPEPAILTESALPTDANGEPDVGGTKAPVDTRLGDAARSALDKLRQGDEALSDEETIATEAIIIPELRPAVDIVDGDYQVTHPTWRKLNSDAATRRVLRAAIPLVGRIELPGHPRIPYGGTGFVVGRGLMMTNRHVAEIFATGTGDRNILFRSGLRAGVDMRRERGRPDGPVLNVRRVAMIHPYWDMALIEVDGLPADLGSLRLSTTDARDLRGREIAVIGYPGYDPLRNDPDVQNRLFDRTYGVKRLQPGQIAAPRRTESFRKVVPAATHDCSTLGGNSGSAVLDLATGEVLALHFGGRYLDTNFAVPAAELARDARVVDAGVALAGAAPAGAPPDWLHYWTRDEASTMDDSAPARGGPDAAPGPVAASRSGGSVTIEIPLRITVELGRMPQAVAAAATAASETTERLVEPDHDTDYAGRRGYDPGFLGGAPVRMPTARDPAVLATLKAGGTELKYENFSILMHAARRLALVTASNVTREGALRRPEPGRDYTRKGLGGLGENDQERWFNDPRLDERFQLPDVFFTRDRGSFDKGHIVRREDVAWGRSYAEVRRANGDTFHVTNCSPQVSQFNQSARGRDNWGDLENLVFAEASQERLCVLAGPVLTAEDQVFSGRADGGAALRARIPSRFWKVIVAPTADGIAAYGFLLEQDLSAVELELAVSAEFRRLQVPLTQIAEAAGVVFDEAVLNADEFLTDRGLEIAWRGGLERATSPGEAEVERPTPNSGDDGDAEPGAARVVPMGDTEAPTNWRVAAALLTLKRQVDARAPGRSKASDGTIGDAAHASRSSDHNPWVRDGGVGVVTALDITHDPGHGCDADAIARAIVASRDDRVKYLIWNRRIVSATAVGGTAAWTWRDYDGANPHTKHVHISVRADKAAYDSGRSWAL